MTQTLRTKIRGLLAAVAALALSAGATTAMAQPSAHRITMDQAEQIALELFPGATVEKVEREVERGVTVYEVELRTDRGVEHEVVIDASDGRVIRTEEDDD